MFIWCLGDSIFASKLPFKRHSDWWRPVACHTPSVFSLQILYTTTKKKEKHLLFIFSVTKCGRVKRKLSFFGWRRWNGDDCQVGARVNEWKRNKEMLIFCSLSSSDVAPFSSWPLCLPTFFCLSRAEGQSSSEDNLGEKEIKMKVGKEAFLGNRCTTSLHGCNTSSKPVWRQIDTTHKKGNIDLAKRLHLEAHSRMTEISCAVTDSIDRQWGCFTVFLFRRIFLN